MNRSILEQNLQALDPVDPDLSRRMREIALDGFQAEAIQTKSNALSARLLPQGKEKPVLLHSAYDPVREATRWAESVQVQSPTNIFILGSGLGYHLLTLLKTHAANIRYLFIIERDPRVLKLALSALDLRPIIRLARAKWFVGMEPDLIPDAVGEEGRTDIILHNCQILPHEPSIQCYPEYYNQVRQQLLDAITYDEVNLRTNFENRGRNQFNVFMNLPALFRGYFPKKFENRFQGFPAVVVAAGPSLDKNLHFLENVNDRAGIIIVDTTQTTFRQKNLRAHTIVTGDPTPLNFSHFEPIDSLGEAFLAFHPEVNRQIPQKFQHHPYLLPLYDGHSDLLSFIVNGEEERCGTVERAMNVGHLAFNFARYLGFAPIILLGFDFAFPKDGGTTHAKEAAVSRSITAVKEDGSVNIGEKAGKAKKEHGKMLLVEGYYGDEVPTTVPFHQYILSLEKSIADCPFQVIDATEGGASFKGSLKMPLQEALTTSLGSPGVQQIWDSIKQESANDFILAEFLDRLQQGREVLQQSRSTCNTLYQMITDWKSRVSNQTLAWPEVNNEWQHFDKLWIEMVGNEMFNAFLGYSVQHLYFLRQRVTHSEDNSANGYLKNVSEKYDFILTELAGLLDGFIESIDLAVQSLHALNKGNPS